MVSSTAPVKGITAVLTIVFVTFALWVAGGYVWPTLIPVEVGPLQSVLDPSLFRRDFTVQESLHFSPRFYYNELILLPARIGLPLAWSFALWHVVALGALVTAVHSLRLHAVATAVLLAWLLMVHVGEVGLVFFYTNAPAPGVWAGTIAACGAACAVRGRYPAAFACFGGAALFQFLVGFYAGVLALPLLLHTDWRTGTRAVVAWGAGLALVYVPLAVSQHGAFVLANDVFVEIYAQLRHPHHLVPSTWPMIMWQRAGWFYAGSWYFLHRTSAGRPALERTLLVGTLALTAGALLVNYFFIEVWPSAFVAKLQPARITPLAQVVILGLIATRLHLALERRRWLLAAAIAATPFSLFPGYALAVAAILGAWDRPTAGVTWRDLVLLATVALSFQGLAGSLGYQLHRHGVWIVPIAIQLIPFWLRPYRLALAAATAAALGVAASAALASTSTEWIGPLKPRVMIDAAPTDAPAVLGRRFRDHSEKDALVLAPPTSEPWIFKLYAQRALVVDDRDIAFTDAGLREWHRRMTCILGRPFVRGIDAAAAWRAQSPETLRTLAAQFGAGYVLTREEWHANLPGHMVDHEQGWTLWKLPNTP